MSEPAQRNEYLDQVMAQQQAVNVELRAKRAPSAAPAPDGGPPTRGRLGPRGGMARARGESPAGGAVDVRITGFWRFRTVIVPPNAYVVHTRRGSAEPLHLGLGVSFRYDPTRDSFLVVPGAMQTILINAYCICRELQGLLVQGYVQWIVADFATAYRKLDFSDVEDPMRVVNVQLREQAEAAIKDKVATMGIDDVLSDKQPIIEELTARLRHVAEGEGGSDKGLGLRIVTVQIKEAVVSSTRVWENLQKPYRAERERVARLAEIEAEVGVRERERAAHQAQETRRIAMEAELAALRAAEEAAAFDRDQGERARRHQREQEVARTVAAGDHETRLRALELEAALREAEAAVARARLEEEIAVARVRAEADIALDDARHAAAHRRAEAEVALMEARQRVANSVGRGDLEARLIDALPAVAERLPKPESLRAVSVAGDGASGVSGLASLVAGVMGVVGAFREGEDGHAEGGGAGPRR